MGNGDYSIDNRTTVGAGAGATFIRNDGQTYRAAELGAYTTIPVGQKLSLNAGASLLKGNGLNGYRATIGATTCINPRLSLNTGLGFKQAKFEGTTTSTEYDYGDEHTTPNQGESEIANPGDYIESGTVYTKDSTGGKQREVFAYADANYRITPKLTVTAGAEGGYKKMDCGTTTELREFSGERYAQKADGSGYIDHYEGVSQHTNITQKSSPVGAVRAGLNYAVSQNVTVGFQGKAGIGRNSDSAVAVKFNVKF